MDPNLNIPFDALCIVLYMLSYQFLYLCIYLCIVLCVLFYQFEIHVC